MEVGELSRAIGKHWSDLWPKVRKQEERKDVGKALSPDEEKRLLDALGKKKRWQLAAVIVRTALLTGMRSGEITGITWGQVDLERKVLTVGKAKTSSGTGRQIPMNSDLFALLSMHASWHAKKFGRSGPSPTCSANRNRPTRAPHNHPKDRLEEHQDRGKGSSAGCTT